MHDIRTIFFDVGGVITHTNWQDVYTTFARRVAIPPHVVIDYHKRYIKELITGKRSFDHFLSDMQKEHPQGSDLRQAWLEEALKLSVVNQPLLDYIDSLRAAGYVLSILSNATESRVVVDEALGLYGHFDHVFVSCHEEFEKPDRRFFELGLSNSKTAPWQSLFIDDHAGHVAAARELGLAGIVFVDNEQLFEDLAALSLPPFE